MARNSGVYLVDGQDEQYKCVMCGDLYPNLQSFFVSNSPFYVLGRLPVCKECMNRMFILYTKKYNNPRKAVQRLCMAFDIYFSDDVFDATDIQAKSFMGEYLRNIATRGKSKNTFETNLDEGFKLAGSKSFASETTEKMLGGKGTKKDEEKWGAGFSKRQYDTLNDHYKLLKTNNPNCDSNQEIFIYDLCCIKMQQLDAMRDGRVDDYNKLTDSYRKTFAQAGLKAAQDPNAFDDETCGKWIELIENYNPAEYYANKPLYEDFDGFDEYMQRHVKRPLINLATGATVRDEEFSIHDDDGGASS